MRQKERFHIEENRDPFDVDITDRRDRQGVHVLGKGNAVDTVSDLLRRQLLDAVLRRWNVVVDGIYKGLIKCVDKDLGLALVDIGPTAGWLRIREGKHFDKEEIMVQIQRRDLGARTPSLSTDIEIPGEYAVIIPKRQIKISHRIRNHRVRHRLHELGKDLASEWGIIWRTAAADQSTDMLRREVTELTEKMRTIIAQAADVKTAALLWGETVFMDVEFPALSKKRLDEIRSTVVSTITDHHFYKIWGGQINSAVDLAERQLELGRQPREVEEAFKRIIEANCPIEDSMIEIEHVKLDGRIINLGRAEIIAFNSDSALITYYRDLKKGGVYDGLGTAKEEGDYAVTEAKIGEWYLKTTYFSKNDEVKGMYINLNTPIELYPCTLRYVDLEVDVSIQSNGEIAVLDMEKLAEKVKTGYITQDLAEKVKAKLKDLVNEVKKKAV